MNLPQEYIDNMKKLLGEKEFEHYIRTFSEERHYGIRLNNKRGSNEELVSQLEKCGLAEKCSLSKVPWIPNGYFASDTAPAASHPFYRAGLYYIQEPSAMTPARSIDIEPEDKVLDMCAAPGGKATQIASKLSKEGFLLANDISASRGKALLKNLEMAGAESFCVTAEDPKKLAVVYPDFFDKIVLDAPCSGEGMFRRDPKGISAWIEKGPSYYAKIQEELLEAAAVMLKNGGSLLYSTCTFSTEENEEQILKLIERHPEFETADIEGYEGFEAGKLGVEKAVRIFPHKMPGEGHFVCLLRKNSPSSDDKNINTGSSVKGILKKLPEQAEEFLSHVKYDFSSGYFIREKERIYYLHKNTDKKDSLRYLRTGLFIGTEIKDRFEPSQALAMVLNKDRFDKCINFKADSIDAEKYIRGESFPINTDIKKDFSWRLICIEGYPLGWAKVSGNMLKNKYETSWRKV